MSERINILDQEELEYLNSSEYKFDYPGLRECHGRSLGLQ